MKIFLKTQNMKVKDLRDLIENLKDLDIELVREPKKARRIIRITTLIEAFDIKNNPGDFWIFIGIPSLENVQFLRRMVKGGKSFKGLPHPANFIRRNTGNYIALEKFDANKIALAIDAELRRDKKDANGMELNIPYLVLKDMQERTTEFVHNQGRYPDKIAVGSEDIPDKVWNQFLKRNNVQWDKEEDVFIGIEKFTFLDRNDRMFFAETGRNKLYYTLEA